VFGQVLRFIIPLFVRLVLFIHQLQAFAARHLGPIISSDTFRLGAESRFLIAGIAHYHAIRVEGVEVTFQAFVAGHRELKDLKI
jgi:hypothetical protein